ncbi:MAG: M1 family peptidase, partial [Mucilaginibacter sp.]
MIKKLFLLSLLTAAVSSTTFAQLGVEKQTFTRADSLRGYNSPLRTCYDINYYHLDIKFDIPNKFISGNVLFKFT